jgi:hypothetical protein
MKYQTRSEETGLAEYPKLSEAFEAGEKDPSIWKISWADDENGERIRLVRVGDTNYWEKWAFTDIRNIK